MSYSYARRRSSETEAPAVAADSSSLRWEIPGSSSSPFSSALAALFGVRADEAEATAVLDAAGAELGEEEGEGADWAADLDAAETTSHEAAPAGRSAAPPARPAAPAAPVTRRPGGRVGEVFDTHTRSVPRMKITLSQMQRTELNIFKRNWERHRARYEAVAARTGVPAILIATIHYRESSMNFNTYLHQGDPLGRPARNHPRNIPVFHDWEEAAVHALNMKRNIRDSLGMTAETTDPVAMATYAEAYNGLGYHYRGLTSPYVYAGTDQYRGGRFVADGKFDPSSWDRRLGVLAIMSEVGELGEQRAPVQGPGTSGWSAVLAGDTALRQGSRGEAVHALQERLNRHGHGLVVDGSFGPATRAAVVAFQRANGLEADGVVGRQTATALDQRGSSGSDEAEQAPELSPRDAAWQQVIGGGEILRVGSRGVGVEALQERLRALGYGLTVDGQFGPITRACVYDLQRGMGLQVDGAVGPQTASAIDRRLGR